MNFSTALGGEVGMMATLVYQHLIVMSYISTMLGTARESNITVAVLKSSQSRRYRDDKGA